LFSEAMVVALIAGTAIATSPAMVHREWRGGYGSEPGNVADIAGMPDLNLSPEQTERIGALREAHRRDIKPIQEQLMGKGRELRVLRRKQAVRALRGWAKPSALRTGKRNGHDDSSLPAPRDLTLLSRQPIGKPPMEAIWPGALFN
jgi:hypothetical protein